METKWQGPTGLCSGAALGMVLTLALSGCAVEPADPLVVDFLPVQGELPTPESFRERGLLLPSRPVVLQASPEDTPLLSSDITSADLHPGPLPVLFTRSQRWVELTLTTDPQLPAASTAELRGYEEIQGGERVVSTSVTLDPDAPIGVRLEHRGGGLQRVEVEYANDGVERVTALRASVIGGAPAADVQAPTVAILSPKSGDTLTGPNGSVQLSLSVNEEAVLRRVSVTVTSGLARTRVELCGPRGGLCPGTPPDFSFSEPVPAFVGRNLIQVDVEDLAGNHATATRGFHMSPGLVRQPQSPTENEPLRLLAQDLPPPVPLPPQPNPGETYELLVLVPEALNDWRMLLFVAHKLEIGTSTYVRTVEQVDADPRFSAGRDIQERIKLAIRHFHEQHETRHVLLLGDVDQFPVRYTQVWDRVYAGHHFMPSDLYYADLYDLADDDVWDGDTGGFDNWDANGNGLIGESGQQSRNARSWAELNVDQVDLKPDVAVGRIPASDTAELGRMLAKIIRYERAQAPSDHPGYLALTGDWSEASARSTSEWIRRRLDDLGQPAATFYAPGAWNDLPDLEWRGSVVNAELNLGKAFVTHFGHGTTNSWAGWYGDGLIFTMARAQFVGEFAQDGPVSQALQQEFERAGVQLGPAARIEAVSNTEWYVIDGLRHYHVTDEIWIIAVKPGSFIPMLENDDRLPVVFAASCDTAMFHFTDMPYRDVDGEEYDCDAVDPGPFDGDASFLQARIFHPDLSAFTLMSTNLDPATTVNPSGDWLFLTEESGWNADNLFRLAAPLVDPRDYWYSLRSQNYPQRFLRHRLFRAELTDVESALDRQDATFRIVPGLANPDTVTANHEYVSFESWNFPGYFLVEIDGRLYLRERGVCDADFERRATFRLRPALSGAPDHHSFESLVGEGRYIRHRNFRFRVESGSGELFEQDSSLQLVGPRHDPTPDYASLVLNLQPPRLLMAGREEVRMGVPATPEEQLAGTLRILTGLDDPAHITFEALVRQDAPASGLNRMYPSHYVRHQDYQLRVTQRLPKYRLNRNEPAAVQDSDYDNDSLAEEFTVKHDGGAIAYLAPHSTTQPVSIDYVRKFFGALQDAPPDTSLGALWMEMVRRYIADEFDRIPHYLDSEDWYAGAIYLHTQKMMFFGDPSVRLRFDE